MRLARMAALVCGVSWATCSTGWAQQQQQPPPPGAAATRAEPEAIAVMPLVLVGEKDRGRALERTACEALAKRFPLAAGLDEGGARPFECDGAVRREARWIVRGRVVNETGGARDSAGQDYRVELELVDASGAHPTLHRHDRCDICRFAEMLERVSHTVTALVDEGVPPPAPVRTPEPPPPPPPPVETPRAPVRHAVDALTIGKWIGVGLFVGLATTGAVMLAYDGRGTCGDPPTGTRCPRQYDTALEGGLVLGAGLAAAGGSALLFALDHRRAHAIAPTVTPTGRGAAAGFVLTF
jgi:hypothetical protein